MTDRSRYRKHPRAAISAVRLALDTDGLVYRKWGAEQRCKAGDWLVDNDGDCYSIDAATFEATYEPVSPGRYIKSAPVWAAVAKEAGAIRTQEGATRYEAGDYLVADAPDGPDIYAVSRAKFERMYVPDEDSQAPDEADKGPD